jgi:hypothetical protein
LGAGVHMTRKRKMPSTSTATVRWLTRRTTDIFDEDEDDHQFDYDERVSLLATS